ncbi:MAG TPA: acetyl-CoA carboxylase biotin carboxyl carrier protein [Gemmatimonadetes bacterium]|nr:acetyl-CoA carboxylase biotin carboxyl carrier protein [Gemmatimonadota bacterium]|tara:strand:- start:3076 stop:3534 length:459 start_codon:yes stop_codon:yes gene_type:complete
MIDPDLIEHLIKILDDSDIDSLEIERGGTRIRLGKTPIQSVTAGSPAPRDEQVISSDPPVQDSPTSADQKSGNMIEVTSPMVGTFYSAPTPDVPPYIEVGDVVKPGDGLCIIEAMKLMNELEAEVAGTIFEICVENAQPVEYGQVLFLMDPA